MYEFRDPIHGFIEVNDLEKNLIDSAPFQRLRNIKQLATTYLVYHGAEHTRFGHSLGVMHLVTKSFETVISKNKDIFDNKKQEWYKQILRLIGLTHDLGHAPFSHASEELFEDNLEHEEYTKNILLNTEIAKHINEIGKYFVDKYGPEYNITPELIWMIYDGKDIWNDKYVYPDYKFLKSFMDSELDCDKMDYLLRDSYYCGVKYGNFDIDRLIASFNIYQNPDEKVLLLAVERGGIHALEEFVLARYFMFIQVYFHKTRRYLDKKLIACLQQILPGGKYPVDIDEYLKWDDTKVLQEIQNKKEVKKQAADFLQRKILSCVHQTDVHADSKETRLFNHYWRDIKEAILKNGVSEDDLARHMLIDEVSKPVHKISEGLEDEKAIPIIVEYKKIPALIYDESLLLKGLKAAISIKRIYVSDDFKHISEEIINKGN